MDKENTLPPECAFQDGSKIMSVKAETGCVCGVVGAVVFVIIVLWCIRCQVRKKSEERELDREFPVSDVRYDPTEISIIGNNMQDTTGTDAFSKSEDHPMSLSKYGDPNYAEVCCTPIPSDHKGFFALNNTSTSGEIPVDDKKVLYNLPIKNKNR